MPSAVAIEEDAAENGGDEAADHENVRKNLVGPIASRRRRRCRRRRLRLRVGRLRLRVGRVFPQ